MTSASSDSRRGRRALSRRAAVLLPAGLLALLGLTIWRLGATASGGSLHEITGLTMGTTYSVKIDADLTAAERAALADTIAGRFTEVDRLMSTYDSTSELSRFNRHRSTDPVVVNPLLLQVVAIAREVSERSVGALDVTVAPLVEAWGFGPTGAPDRAPTEDQLARLREQVGYRLVQVDSAAGTLAKQNPRTVIDLSAVAKGYGVDRVADALRELGVTAFLAEAGGELRAEGTKRDGTPWRVGIERPDPAQRRVFRAVDLMDEAIATSGDYRQSYEYDGVRYAHIVDPRTGQPIRYAGVSVSVVDPSAAVADAWATALSVLGPGEGFRLAEREDVAAVFVVQTDTGLTSRETTRFRRRHLVAPDHESE